MNWCNYFSKDAKEVLAYTFGEKRYRKKSKCWEIKQIDKFLFPPNPFNLSLLSHIAKGEHFKVLSSELEKSKERTEEFMEDEEECKEVIVTDKSIKVPSISKLHYRLENLSKEEAIAVFNKLKTNNKWTNLPSDYTENREFQNFFEKNFLEAVINPLFGNFTTFILYAYNTVQGKLVFFFK